jgi:CRISPR-associated endonuclease/helicase Cas3
MTTSQDGVREKHPLTSGKMPANASRFAVELETGDDSRLHLASYVSKREKPEWGSTAQSLRKHVHLVRQRIDEILADLDLAEPLKLAAQLAAEYHDHGKNRERWQNAAKGKAAPPGEEWTDDTLGKSGGSMKRDSRHYRHEFGSLRELIDEGGAKTLTNSEGADITKEVIDLALHLIAAHHGRGRPHFPKGGFDPDAESRSPQIHADVMRRFGRLQRKYGWWRLAWLENLLRCADAIVGADDEAKRETTTLLAEYGCAK